MPSLRPNADNREDERLLFRHVGQKPDVSRPQHGFANRPLKQSRGPGASAGQNPPFPIDQRAQGLEVLVIDIHGTGDIAIRAESAFEFLFEPSPLFPAFANFRAIHQGHRRESLPFLLGYFSSFGKSWIDYLSNPPPFCNSLAPANSHPRKNINTSSIFAEQRKPRQGKVGWRPALAICDV